MTTRRIFFLVKTNIPYYRELLLWCVALAYLAFIDPHAMQSFSFCPLHNLGFSFCPGCGLGRSVSLLIHGELSASVQMHLLGIPATILIVQRIYILVKKIIEFKKIQHSLT